VRQLPGRPDLVFPRRRAVIFVHGCFWHGHDCPLFKRPASRQEFWDAKIARNRENDVRAAESLKQAGWRMMTVWECALRGPSRLGIADVLARIESWLDGQEAHSELRSTES
jgi:DNA mismatch endonuclease (patch repair protein)